MPDQVGLPTMVPMFVHLRLHTEFSVVDGTNRIDDLAKAAAKDGQPALAITDLSNLFGAIKFYKEMRGKGVKPILGAEIFLEGEAGAAPSRILLLVQGHQGYLNLSELRLAQHQADVATAGNFHRIGQGGRRPASSEDSDCAQSSMS